MTNGIRNYRTQKPRLTDFYNDMNEHGSARYGRVLTGETAYVLELERHRPFRGRPGSFTLTVWKPVREKGHPERFVSPDLDENRYEWDAVGRAEWSDDTDGPDAAQRTFRKLKSEQIDVVEWCDGHPYTGPRTPYHEKGN